MGAPVLVAAGVIMRDGLVLVAQRKEDCRREALKWEFPGGKLEPGETPEECLRREIMEELGLEIEVGERFCTSKAESGDMSIVLMAYKALPLRGEPRALDVRDWRWAAIGELRSFDWAKADLPVVEKLIAQAKIK